MIGKAIYAQLAAASAVTAIAGTRIYPEAAPQNGRTFPLIVYELDDQENVRSMQGGSGVANRTVRITCCALPTNGGDGGTDTINALADAIDAALDDQAGTWGGVVVQGAFQQSRGDAIQTNFQGEDFKVWVVELQYEIWFEN